MQWHLLHCLLLVVSASCCQDTLLCPSACTAGWQGLQFSCLQESSLCAQNWYQCLVLESFDTRLKRSPLPRGLFIFFLKAQPSLNHAPSYPQRYRRLGSEFLGKRGSEFLGKRGLEFLGKRSSEFLGKRGSEFFEKKGSEFMGKRGSEFLGKRGSEFLGKRSSEFLGKRGNELLGKRSSEFLGKRGSEFLGKRGVEFLGKRGTELLGKRREMCLDENCLEEVRGDDELDLDALFFSHLPQDVPLSGNQLAQLREEFQTRLLNEERAKYSVHPLSAVTGNHKLGVQFLVDRKDATLKDEDEHTMKMYSKPEPELGLELFGKRGVTSPSGEPEFVSFVKDPEQ